MGSGGSGSGWQRRGLTPPVPSPPLAQDRVAQHSHDHDPFAHHVLDAPVTEAVAELTDVAPEFDAGMLPNRDHLEAALDAKASCPFLLLPLFLLHCSLQAAPTAWHSLSW